jgi:hypothetical protein
MCDREVGRPAGLAGLKIRVSGAASGEAVTALVHRVDGEPDARGLPAPAGPRAVVDLQVLRVSVGRPLAPDSRTRGSIPAGVGASAGGWGLIPAGGGTTEVPVRNLDPGLTAVRTVQPPRRRPFRRGTARKPADGPVLARGPRRRRRRQAAGPAPPAPA